MPMTGYFVRYRLFDVNNTITLHSSAQLRNWSAAMENEFDSFEIIGVYEFDY